MQARSTLKDRVDHLKGLVDLLAHFRTSQHDLATHEDQKHNFWLDHSINETGEQFGLVRAEHVMTTSQAFETNGELDIARALIPVRLYVTFEEHHNHTTMF